MVADSGNGRVQMFDAASYAYAATLGGSGQSPRPTRISGCR
ncbi:MAG: hypothetical protein WDN69_12010 [Aliidongia sp.]